MVAKRITDTMTDTQGSRLKVHRDRDGTTYYPYSNGTEIVTRPSGGPSKDGKLKGVKQVVKATSPHGVWISAPENDTYADRYDRAFRKGKYADAD